MSLLNAPLIRMSFSVSIASDHVRLADDKNRFKVVLPDQLLESVFSGYYEVRVLINSAATAAEMALAGEPATATARSSAAKQSYGLLLAHASKHSHFAYLLCHDMTRVVCRTHVCVSYLLSRPRLPAGVHV